MKPSEFGGSDTNTTQGIQPDPHSPSASEQLRMMYNKGPEDSTPIAITDAPKRRTEPGMQVP